MTDDSLTVYVAGEPAIIRGVEREEAETTTGLDFTDVWLHVDFVESPEAETTKVNISEVKCEGALAALTEHLLERDLVPEWWADNDPLPDSLD